MGGLEPDMALAGARHPHPLALGFVFARADHDDVIGRPALQLDLGAVVPGIKLVEKMTYLAFQRDN